MRPLSGILGGILGWVVVHGETGDIQRKAGVGQMYQGQFLNGDKGPVIICYNGGDRAQGIQKFCTGFATFL